ncbi:uncharacterized protein JCM6883_004020 [Sporobolomyces salmoneus]|uniref:uncharacterized protein n=1 Tax=Sporobolomyces salmoneus TaxID=183962 RepID=UPI0031717898
MTDPTPSLLAHASALRSHLLTTFPPSSSPHLLSTLPPSELAHLRSHLSSTISTLRTSLSSFESLLPAPSLEESATEPRRLELDKYLSLLSQSSSTEALLLSLSDSTSTPVSHSTSQRRYPILHPEELSKSSHLVLPILERIAKDLGLVCFRDDEEEDAEAGGKREEERVVTSSLGGKVMVVDFKVHRQSIEKGEMKEVVEGVKVAYVWKGEQIFDERGGKILSDLFSASRNDKGERDDRQEKEEIWSNVGRVLKELHELDERTEKEEMDWFAKLNQLVERVETEFPQIDRSPNPPTLPALLPTPSSLHPILLISLSPSALLHPSTRAYLSSTATTSSSTLLNRFLDVPGVYAVEFELPTTLSSKNGGGETVAEKKESEWWRIRLVSPEGGIAISRELGKRVWEELGANRTLSEGTATGASKAEEKSRETGEENLTRKRKGRSMTDLMLLSTWWTSESRNMSRNGDDETRLTPSSHTITFEPKATTTGHLSPHSYRFRLASDDIPSSSLLGGQEAFVLSSLWLLEEDPDAGKGSEGMKSLRKALDILKQQIKINDLVFSVISPSTRDATSASEAQVQAGKTREGSTKRRKLEEKESMSLDNLFADQNDQSHPLPVFIHFPSTSLSSQSQILLSFPTPHLPPHQASPVSILISSSDSGYSIEVKTKLENVRNRLEDGGGKVLELTGDLGVFLSWVVVKKLATL